MRHGLDASPHPCLTRDQPPRLPPCRTRPLAPSPRGSPSTMSPRPSSNSSSRTGGDPTPRSARPSGLSEAAVRQRVQRLTENGVMQIVAVTDPLQLGFARQAMIGINVDGQLDPVAEELGKIDEVDYVVMTAGGFDLLCEVVCESDSHLLDLLSTPDPRGARGTHHRDLHVPQADQADLLVGRSLTCGSDYRSLSLWHDTADDDVRTASRAARPGVVRRRRGRRRPHRALDGVLPAPGRPVAPDRGARGGGGRLRRLRPQRRLVQRAVPDPLGQAGQGVVRRMAPSACTARCRRRCARSAGSPTPRGSTRTTSAGARSPWPAPRCSCDGCGPRSRTAHARGFTEDDERLLDADEASAMLAADGVLGGGVHPALRGDPPRAAGARTGARGRGVGRRDLRADPRARHPARPGGDRRGHRDAPRWCCAPPRATRRGWPGSAARWRRCTR